MMKSTISILIVLVIYSLNLSAQGESANSIDRQHELSLGSAISFPKGDFGNTAVNDESSGFAKTGYSIEIAYHNYSKKRPIAIYTALSFSGYEVDSRKIDTEMKRNQPDNIFTTKASASTVTVVKLGVTGFFRRGKVRGYITPYAGYAFLNSDFITDKFHSTGSLDCQIRVASSIPYDDEDAVSSVTVMVGGNTGIEYIFKNILVVSLDYSYSLAAFQIERLETDIWLRNRRFTELSVVRQLYIAHNLGLKVGWLF